jgi:predicted AlkP superfamily phosphohydrolase/phosphomutase
MATITFGLDGANWPLIEPWMDDGLLPNIQRLREEGLWGVSRSVAPPTTCPNWKCYASSRGPDAHDVYWWERVNKETFETDTPDSTSFSAPELWDYLNESGRRVGIMNLPMSYPPRQVDGFMIAGGPPTKSDGYTVPESLEQKIESEYEYRVHPNTTIDGQSGRGVEETLELIETRFETARRLFEQYDLDFFHLTIFYINVLQHNFWNAEPVKRGWKIIDKHIGHFLDEGHTIFLMSDHGCTEIETTFYVNEWLQQKDFLTLDTSVSDYLMKTGITQERLGAIISTLRLKGFLTRVLPRRVISKFPRDDGLQHAGKFTKVNFEESIAIGSGQGLIYVLEQPGTEAYETYRTELIEELSSMTTPAGTPLSTTIYTGEDIYPNGNPLYRPDIVFDQGPGVHTAGTVGYGQVMDDPSRWRAENVRDGLFLAHGDEIEASGKISPISILDIAPSILYAMDEDIPRDFEGDPVTSTNADRGEPTFRDPLPKIHETSNGANEAARERLADIGYLN